MPAQILKKPEELNSQSDQSFDSDFSIPFKNGEGEYKKDIKTFGSTIRGCFVIKEPNEGTWTVIGYDGKKEIFRQEGVRKGQRVSFGPYKTGAVLHLRVIFIWSEKQDTTLKGRVHAETC